MGEGFGIIFSDKLADFRYTLLEVLGRIVEHSENCRKVTLRARVGKTICKQIKLLGSRYPGKLTLIYLGKYAVEDTLCKQLRLSGIDYSVSRLYSYPFAVGTKNTRAEGVYRRYLG